MTESAEARRHRYARAIRGVSSLESATQLLEAYEVDLHAGTDLLEIEQLPGWTYADLLGCAVKRRPCPTYQADDGVCLMMKAQDLLSSRKYELIGMLARATEQAWLLGDGQTVASMARLTKTAVLNIIGEAVLALAPGFTDPPQGEA